MSSAASSGGFDEMLACRQLPWLLERRRDRAGPLHEASAELLTGVVRRRVRVLEATRPAVVLGSAEPEAHVDRRRAARLGVDVVRRRSGGGAVLVGPNESAWVDLVIPRGDPLWHDDVGVAARWVGRAWAAALAATGVAGAVGWAGPMVRTPWSGRVCFAGLGPGEVVRADPSGRRPKLVGVSARRTKGGALFQTALLLRWRPIDLLDVLDLDPRERGAAAADLAAAAVGIGASLGNAAVGALAGILGAGDPPEVAGGGGASTSG